MLEKKLIRFYIVSFMYIYNQTTNNMSDEDLMHAIIDNNYDECLRLITLGANVNRIFDIDKYSIGENDSGVNYILYECIRRP